MNPPLIWMPTWYVPAAPTRFDMWQAKRFLAAHAGRGHIISPIPLARSISQECTTPHKDYPWYTHEVIPDSLQVASITLEVSISTNWQLIAARLQDVPCRRLVVCRRPGQSLDALIGPLEELTCSISCERWLDLPSFGWVAAEYFLSRDPNWQLANVDDLSLARLLRLAHWLDRPVMLKDYSGRPAIPISPLPEFGMGSR